MDLRVQEGNWPVVSWPSVFAGTFVFFAIEVTFGLLGAAIFPPTHGAAMVGAGPGIWMIVLSTISLYFGAKAGSHLAGVMRKLDGLYMGLVTFGLSIFGSLLAASIFLGSTMNAGTTMSAMTEDNALWLFVTLILGGIAAAIGGTASVPAASKPVAEPVAMRPAA